jgi:hypothetical protein
LPPELLFLHSCKEKIPFVVDKKITDFLFENLTIFFVFKYLGRDGVEIIFKFFKVGELKK